VAGNGLPDPRLRRVGDWLRTGVDKDHVTNFIKCLLLISFLLPDYGSSGLDISQANLSNILFTFSG